MFTILLYIIFSSLISLGASIFYFKSNKNINNLLPNKLKNSKPTNKFSNSYFIKLENNIIFDNHSIYASLKLKIDTASIDKNHYKELLYFLKSFYILESKFKDLLDLKLISNNNYNYYIKSIEDKRRTEYDSLYNQAINGYTYSFKGAVPKLDTYIERLNEILDGYDAKNIIKNINKQDKIKTISSDKVNKKSDVKDELLMSINYKNSLLNNVISNSLSNNANNLVKTKSNPTLSEEAIDLIDLQLRQIDSFLQKEIDLNSNLSDSELINKLKANQIYLDSLETHWTSEIK